MVCAITTHGGRAEGGRNDLEVPIPPGLPVKGVVLPHQMRTVDCKARHSKNYARFREQRFSPLAPA